MPGNHWANPLNLKKEMGNSDMKPVKIAIIGLRHLHPRSYMLHFTSLAETDVVAVVEENKQLRDAFARDYNLSAYDSIESLYAHHNIDLAAIFLPHIDCPDAALKCIEHGTHVLIEKPMTANSTSAEKIVAAAKKKNVILTTPYVWRYHPVVRDIRRILDDGILGSVINCEGRCAAGRLTRYIEGQSEWMLDARKSGGGPMYNLGVHWIDLFNWLLNDRVESVYGKNVKINEAYNIEDNSFAILSYQNGVVLNLNISYTVPDSYPHGRDLYIAIRGTKGVLAWSPAFEGENDELFICSDADHINSAPVRKRLYDLKPYPGYSGVMGYEYLRDVAREVARNGTAPITGEDGVVVLKIVEAIYRSNESKSICYI